MMRCYSCQYGQYTAKEEGNDDACWFVAKKDVPYRTYTLFKTITKSQVNVGLSCLRVVLPTKAVRPLEDCENDAGTTRSFPPNFMGWLVAIIKNDNIRFVMYSKPTEKC